MNSIVSITETKSTFLITSRIFDFVDFYCNANFKSTAASNRFVTVRSKHFSPHAPKL